MERITCEEFTARLARCERLEDRGPATGTTRNGHYVALFTGLHSETWFIGEASSEYAIIVERVG